MDLGVYNYCYHTYVCYLFPYMISDRRNLIEAACRHALKPIVRFLLRNGMTFREFSDVSRSVFVEVASTDYGIGGRPTNASRVSILTGLTRREVKRQRDLLTMAEHRVEGSENLATRILSGWYHDPDFTDANGKPLELPIDGPVPSFNSLLDRCSENLATRILSGWFQDPDFTDANGKPLELQIDGPVPSFKSLLDRYSGDVPPTAMLKEMKIVGAVSENADGNLRVLSRTYIPAELDNASIRQWSVALHDLGHTINHNTNTKDGHAPRLERMAINPLVQADVAEAFRELVATRGQEFLEQMDNWLSANEPENSNHGSDNGKRLGVGIYFIEDEQESLS